jgi:putative acetyltransferase
MGAGTVKTLAERPGDEAGIRAVHDTSFGQVAEGQIVDELRISGAVLLSLVAELDGEVVGHVMFSAASFRSDRVVVALGPLGVLPKHQRQGVGTALVRDGLFRLRGMGVGAVVVLGDPRYYGRFGFRRASAFGVRAVESWPDEAFQAIELQPQALADGGVVGYAKAFFKVS